MSATPIAIAIAGAILLIDVLEITALFPFCCNCHQNEHGLIGRRLYCFIIHIHAGRTRLIVIVANLPHPVRGLGRRAQGSAGRRRRVQSDKALVRERKSMTM
jgi:hypothetical protein